MDELLSAARNYLDVTWEDPELDRKLTGILSRGRTYLDGIAGEPMGYDEGSQERGLLLDYVRYVRAGAMQDFSSDFSRELNALHARWEVWRHAQCESDV